MIAIQATFTGYGGSACTLFSAFDPDAKILVIGAETAYRAERREGAIVLTNDPEISRDMLFGNDRLREAIEAYFALKSGVSADGKSPRIAFSERAARTNPAQAIEQDGIDTNGPRFRVSDGVTCGQIAALATCLHASKSNTIDRSVRMAEQFRGFARCGRIIRI